MFLSLKYQRYKWFWTLRDYFNKLIFYINKIFFKQREKIDATREKFLIAKNLFKIIIPSFLFAFFLVIVLEESEKLLLNILITKPVFVRDFLYYFHIFHNNLIKHRDSIETLLSTITSTFGIFLGLYFTAVSVVASSFFARVPSNLRGLLLKEKVGNLYMSILAVLISISIILLGYLSFGRFPGVLNSLVIIFLGVFCILCFVKLGLGAFNLFDPTTLSNNIFRDLLGNIKSSTIHGFKWNDPTFQSHYQKLAATNISTLDTLIDLCVTERQLQKQSLSHMLQRTIYFLIKYEQQRALIPSNSYWYTLIPQYKNTFLQNSSALKVALQTQTPIQPEMVPYPYWVEDNIIELLVPTIKKLFQQEELETIYETINIVNKYFEKLGKNLELKKGLEILNKLAPEFKSYFDHISPKNNYKDIEFALFDAYGLTTLSLTVGFFNMVRDTNIKTILEEIDSINWNNSKSIYQKGFIPLMLPEVEDIQKRLKFEKIVEKGIISPNWYLEQLILIYYTNLFEETVNELLLSLEIFYVTKSSNLLSSESFILAALHSQRGLEMCDKAKAIFPLVKGLVVEFEKKGVNKDLTWPKWDWNQIENKVNESYDKLMGNLAKCLPHLSLIQNKKNLPDLFGQAYNIVCQDCYNAMILKNVPKLKNLFSLQFFGSTVAYDK